MSFARHSSAAIARRCGSWSPSSRHDDLRAMKRFLGIAIGIVTSIGGFLPAGLIAASAHGRAAIGSSLVRALALGTLCVIFLVVLSGLFAVASEPSVPDAHRQR